MSRSAVRATLRKARQERNKASLTEEQKKRHPVAAEHFIVFGGKRGKRTNKAGNFEYWQQLYA